MMDDIDLQERNKLLLKRRDDFMSLDDASTRRRTIQ
jgi:hypothetical protein